MQPYEDARYYWLIAITIAGLTFIFADDVGDVWLSERDRIGARWLYALSFCLTMFGAYLRWLRPSKD